MRGKLQVAIVAAFVLPDGSTPRGLAGTDTLVPQADDTVQVSTEGGQTWSAV